MFKFQKSKHPRCYKDWPKVTLLNEDYRFKLHNLYLAITHLNLWDYIFENPPDENKGYMFTEDRNFNKIKRHFLIRENFKCRGSFAFCMRRMLYISQFGFNEFKKNYNIETNKIDSDVFFLKI